MNTISTYISFFLLLFWSAIAIGNAQEVRKELSLNHGWKTIASGALPLEEKGFEKPAFDDSQWLQVDVPHNWDQYEGFRRMKHGNRHGAAWYRKTFKPASTDEGKRHFLFFEGVGSYATVWVNGQLVGKHAGGRTTFTLDITDALAFGAENTIAVKADHPAWIADLPWVCGGCSGEWGFSEGSQPMGIFRPVTLVVTDPVRIAPFGVHIWNDEAISEKSAKLHLTTELKNYGKAPKDITLVNRLLDADGKEIDRQERRLSLAAGQLDTIPQTTATIEQPNLWSPANPYLYSMVTEVYEGDRLMDKISTPYGIRWISWPAGRKDGDHRFFINGKPLFVNGICEYEHLMGQSHAFTDQQVMSRVEQMLAAGFNAFRDAHQPHNFTYHEAWDRHGILFWTQFSAHIWYDTPEFKANFKKLLRDWVKERRNSPSVVLWGLQNESTIPKAFAEECTAIIREMDPTTSSQRLVTTCNGGEGTDWNVIQNWSGTYGGEPEQYGEELSEQILNGEYGAWRTLDLHTTGPFDQKGAYSEDRFYQLMQIKVREAEQHKDSLAGQFHWLFNSHENPGRIQNGEAFRDIDRVGPVNYKGLVTPWEEPTDAYYMYRSEYAPETSEPMVYLVSHTWPDRWIEPGIKDSVVVFSNCEEVELFNSVNGHSLGKKVNPGLGSNFQWDDVDIRYNVLKAVGYRDGEVVAEDMILLHHLPEAPDFDQLVDQTDMLKSAPGYHYLYRVNAGGPAYTDQHGQFWHADVQRKDKNSWGSLSWTDDFEDLPAYYASQRRTFDPIGGVADWGLLQTFRYGKHKLRYAFPLPDGEYLVELYFVEPWYGTGGSLEAAGWRDFDVAISGDTVLRNVDIWQLEGHDQAMKKVVKGSAKDGLLTVSFPKITAGQAVISAIAIATKEGGIHPAPPSPKTITNFQSSQKGASVQSWLDTGQPQYADKEIAFSQLPYNLYGADWVRFPTDAQSVSGTFQALESATLYVLMDSAVTVLPDWMAGFERTDQLAANGQGTHFHVYEKALKSGEEVDFGENGAVSEGEASMYTLVLVPAYEMGDGEEQRPVEALEAESAQVDGSFTTGNFKKSDYIAFEKDNSFSWEVNPGLAGTFLIRFRYMNNGDDPKKVRLRITAANGVVMRDDVIAFPVADVKWKILNTTSGGQLNAGKYTITLSGEGLDGLWLDRVEFQ
ncbi:malectin domain-containing carbohydrate-binding protein [Echinicola vietnamensis]|uniref:Beta-galactosidase/beta-glucuronidase n=1 Tax=Echinicola vietnamensis (strain DSM 17526 / LMG 23754 / KMM 6221) TaxID=926556 RepID=L0FY05_ECHVK|nr:malectin domain-containing carbohydrate-binding protein [Echinicola vietnamensis]AGA77933.1 beta-galactosidase/beta-glucuronidase [Echinicola vietnamensis DSM 17526]